MSGGSVPTGFQVWAAVDLLEGRAVRLRQGEPSKRTDYGEALEAALGWARCGCRLFHVVDLGAALGGAFVLPAFVGALRSAWPDLTVQCGGGVRSLERCVAAVEAGAERVVVGSLIFEQPEETLRILAALGPDRCVAALDGRDGRLRLRGWTQEGGLRLEEALARARGLGFRHFLVTDIARDGEGTGPNLDLYRRLSASGQGLLASGGVRDAGDLAALAALPGVEGAIVGRALYEGRLDPARIAGGTPWSA